jgi:hypothetical protein
VWHQRLVNVSAIHGPRHAGLHPLVCQLDLLQPVCVRRRRSTIPAIEGLHSGVVAAHERLLSGSGNCTALAGAGWLALVVCECHSARYSRPLIGSRKHTCQTACAMCRCSGATTTAQCIHWRRSQLLSKLTIARSLLVLAVPPPRLQHCPACQMAPTAALHPQSGHSARTQIRNHERAASSISTHCGSATVSHHGLAERSSSGCICHHS